MKKKELELELFEGLKAGNEGSIINVYDLYRSEFIHWCTTNYSTDEESAADIFQDTVIAFYYNIRNGLLRELSSSVKTYLFAIGKNLALKKIRKEAKMVMNDEVLELNAAFSNLYLFDESDRK